MRQPPPRLKAASPKTLTEVKRKEEVPVNGPVYPFNGLGYQPSLAIAYPYFPPASAAALPAAVYNQMPINQNVQAGFDKNGQPWKPHFKFVQPSITTTTTTTTTTTATTTTVTTPTPSTTTTTTSASTERIVEEDNATSVGEPVAAMLQQQNGQSADANFDNSGQSAASLVIGLTFVAAFLSIALGLVAHTVASKLKAPRPKPGQFMQFFCNIDKLDAHLLTLLLNTT